ncbi:MAG: molybdopterin-dependent oxidoreductase [Bacteroidales bacterium]
MWRGNALMSSAKGHEFFLKHYLGTHHNALDEDVAGPLVKEIIWRENAPEGKLDLVVDINFRMDTSALYSDIVLPTATWYEKNDLNSTDLHSYIHPLTAAVPPSWESKTDWDIFRNIARVTSQLATKHLPGNYKDIVNVPIQHDTVGETAQAHIKDWYLGECEPIPGKNMHNMVVVERDYSRIYKKHNFIFC